MFAHCTEYEFTELYKNAVTEMKQPTHDVKTVCDTSISQWHNEPENTDEFTKVDMLLILWLPVLPITCFFQLHCPN